MKRGVIFTIDALIALSVFLVSASMLYGYFYEEPSFALTGSGIYTKTENVLRTGDKSEMLSSAFNLYQKGDTTAAEQVLDLVLSASEFPTNLRIYSWNGTDLKNAKPPGLHIPGGFRFLTTLWRAESEDSRVFVMTLEILQYLVMDPLRFYFIPRESYTYGYLCYVVALGYQLNVNLVAIAQGARERGFKL